MPHQTQSLVGNWEKITHSQCSRIYPESIEFQERGLYVGRAEQPGAFTEWDVGTYALVDARHVKLSTASDAVIAYQFTLSGDQLTFVDQASCTFSYRRSASEP